MTIEQRVDAIAGKVREARERGLTPFGADSHRWKVQPPLPEASIAAFESRYALRLPEDYRAFLLRVGSGGAGPAYGLVPFEEALGYEYDGDPGDRLAAPFPFTAAYNPYEDPQHADYFKHAQGRVLSPADEERRGEARRREVAGTMVLCHEGCGYLHLLVVKGAAHGRMWIDGTVSDGGYVPLGATFLEWYERWIDDVLAGGDGVWW